MHKLSAKELTVFEPPDVHMAQFIASTGMSVFHTTLHIIYGNSRLIQVIEPRAQTTNRFDL